jgi:MoxR-like ATPase
MSDWKIFVNKSDPHDAIKNLPEAPPWRRFKGVITKERNLPVSDEEAKSQNERGATFETGDEIVEMVNAALYLRRPLLLTGKPGSGKSSLIYAVARQLKLGEVLRWPITSRSTLKEALYVYDAIGRLHHQQLSREETNIGDFLELGPLGTALLPTSRARALLIDEIDKSDIDLPNDLLNVFEEGEYHIPELARLGQNQRVIDVRAFGGTETFPIQSGHVRCNQFPFVVLTSNGEREFPTPFLRRCLRLSLPEPDVNLLTRIVTTHLGAEIAGEASAMISDFATRSKNAAIATDQLLNAVFLVTRPANTLDDAERKRVLEALLKELAASQPPSV